MPTRKEIESAAFLKYAGVLWKRHDSPQGKAGGWVDFRYLKAGHSRCTKDDLELTMWEDRLWVHVLQYDIDVVPLHAFDLPLHQALKVIEPRVARYLDRMATRVDGGSNA